MKSSHHALSLILDSITEHIVVICPQGAIQYANKSWSNFGESNACNPAKDWIGVNYLTECDKASAMGDEFGEKAGDGIRRVIQKELPIFYFEYPCHSLEEKRWFMMRVTPLRIETTDYYVISHQNITERKLAEEEIQHLASLDGLTSIANRRTFNHFLHEEWNRCYRLQKPISLAILDLDHFKLLNDHYGHQSGDHCLIKMGELLKGIHYRPSDICARYGGEEFAIIWGDTNLVQAKQLSEQLLKDIVNLNIPNAHSPTEQYLTASIGLAELIPTKINEEHRLITKADGMLYKAKKNGRNKIEN